MLKTIKKSFKYLMILVGIMIMVPTFFSLLLRIPEVQTFIVKRITSHFSEQIKSTVTVGRFEYSFFNKIRIDDILIKDQNLDTMIYARKMTAGITGFNFKRSIFKLGSIDLTEPQFALITDTAGTMNLNWYLDMLTKSDKSSKKTGTFISFNQISLKDGKFCLIDRNSALNKKRIDFSHLYLSGINGNVEKLRVQNDSVLFRLNDIGFSESKGFFVRSLNSDIIISRENKIFRNVFLYLDSSIISADRIVLNTDTTGSFRDFENNVRLDIVLQKSTISAADLKYFVPSLDIFSGWVEVSGRITGPFRN